MKNTNLLVILGRGGHTEQILRLVNKLGKRYNYEYVISENDNLSKKKIKYRGRIFRIRNPREMSDKNPIIVFFKLFKTTFQSIKILFKSKAKTIITCGPGLAIPISIIGKLLFQKKLIFIESWSRVYSKSLAGLFSYRISDLTFIQWPEQKENYPEAIFAGRLG
ncbi:hypothetical protein GF386_00440 [Candidatus Pacearchaeota archaeon]|nr:hypothetical protein [Candidatus Pacearchaeota archaeon]